MVRTVKVIRVLSANKEGKSTPALPEKNISPDFHKKGRYIIRVAKSDSGLLPKLSDTILIPSNERATQGIDDQKNSTVTSDVKDNASTGVKIIGTPTGNVSRKTGLVALPQKRRQAIVSVENGGKGIIMNSMRNSTLVPTSNDAPKKLNGNRHNDGSKEFNHCYPPNEHTVLLLKLLSSGEILSCKELDEIVSYVGYLKSRKLVMDHLLNKKIISLITEPQEFQPEASDDEPPIVPSKVKIPVISSKRRASPSEDSVPSKMPRLLEVLQSNDLPTGVTQMIERKRASVPRARETRVACEMCGSRVQFTHLKMHQKICKGILIRRPQRAPDGSPSNAEEDKRTRTCPRCEKTLSCNSDFEMHMAVAHNFYWRLEFDKEEEFKAWFREEGLDETMYVATCQTNPDFQQKVYYCAINRNQASNVKKCPCRLVVKRVPTGIIVRYLILHNHTERFVRRIMSVECRDMIVKLLKEGFSNYGILKKVKEAYPKTSMNYYITRESITRLRYRYIRKCKTRKREPLRKSRRTKIPDVDETALPFSDDNQQEAWALPELRNAEVNARNSYHGVEDVNDCSVIEATNF